MNTENIHPLAIVTDSEEEHDQVLHVMTGAGTVEAVHDGAAPLSPHRYACSQYPTSPAFCSGCPGCTSSSEPRTPEPMSPRYPAYDTAVGLAPVSQTMAMVPCNFPGAWQHGFSQFYNVPPVVVAEVQQVAEGTPQFGTSYSRSGVAVDRGVAARAAAAAMEAIETLEGMADRKRSAFVTPPRPKPIKRRKAPWAPRRPSGRRRLFVKTNC